MPKIKSRIFLVVGALLLASACSPGYVIVRQANPNPFKQSRSFVMEPVQFANLQVGKKTEAAYLATKKPEEQQKWQTNKVDMAQFFTKTALGNAHGVSITAAQPGKPVPAGASVIRTVIDFIEPGQYSYVYAINTLVRSRVQILDASGKVLDEFWMQATEPASMLEAAVGTRLRNAAAHDAIILDKYLADRVK